MGARFVLAAAEPGEKDFGYSAKQERSYGTDEEDWQQPYTHNSSQGEMMAKYSIGRNAAPI
jgi:hypothetical protein